MVSWILALAALFSPPVLADGAGDPAASPPDVVVPVAAPSLEPSELDALAGGRPWQVGRRLNRTGLVLGGVGSGFVLGGAAHIALVSWSTYEGGGPTPEEKMLFAMGGICGLASLSTLTTGLAMQNRALRDAGLSTNPAFLAVSMGGVGALGAWLLVPSLRHADALGYAGASMVAGGFIVQSMENHRVLRGKGSMWSAAVQPWSDGDHHGLALAVAW
jgi:uncharacterized membrane protein YhaH (DUF805 family)